MRQHVGKYSAITCSIEYRPTSMCSATVCLLDKPTIMCQYGNRFLHYLFVSTKTWVGCHGFFLCSFRLCFLPFYSLPSASPPIVFFSMHLSIHPFSSQRKRPRIIKWLTFFKKLNKWIRAVGMERKLSSWKQNKKSKERVGRSHGRFAGGKRGEENQSS